MNLPLHPATDATDLPRPTKEAMLLTALVQGLAVYVLTREQSLGALRTVGVTLVLAVPGFFLLCVQSLRDRLLWWIVAALAVLLGGLNASVWWISGAEQRWVADIWMPWALCQGVLLLVALAWAQAWLRRRSLRQVPYALLFQLAWNNAMVLAFALLFVGLAWALLGLWAGLFALVKVKLFASTFTQPLFVCVATGLMAGLGVLLARGQPRPLQTMLQLLLALCRLLLPLLALVVVLFVAFLPFTGVQPLWDTRRAAPLLMGVLLWLMLLVNAVYQDGERAQAPYAPALRVLVSAALALMPVLAALALWAVALRVQQYGWTHERVWAGASAAVLLLYALGYAAAALRGGSGAWLAALAPVNRSLSWVVMGVLVLLHTPFVDPYRIGAQSQRERLAQGLQEPTLEALQNLRFDHGRHGQAALQSLQSLPGFAQGRVQQDLHQVLTAKAKQYRSKMAADSTALPELVAVVPGQPAPAADWWQALQQPELRNDLWACRKRIAAADAAAGTAAASADCVALQLALDASDEKPRQLLCRVGSSVPTCTVYGRDAHGSWQRQGRLRWQGLNRQERERLAQALRAGDVQTQPSRWRDVAVPGAQGLPAGRME